MKGLPGWKSLGFETYLDFLNSNFWKEKRKWILKAHNNMCNKCGSDKSLQIHHLNYFTVGNEGGDDVIVLCKSCHEKEHERNI